MNLVSILPENLIFFQENFYYLILFVSTLLILFFCILLIGLLIKELKVSRVPEDAVKEAAYRDALRILDDARVRSLKILNTSQEKAARSLEDTANLSKATKEEFKSKLRELYRQQETMLSNASGEILTTYKKAMEDEKVESIKTLSDSISQVKDELQEEISEFKNVLRKQTYETQRQIEEKLQMGYQEVEKEIGEYKSEKITQIHDKLLETLATVSVRVLGVTISTDDQEKFIYDALKDELKKAGLVREASLEEA